MNRERQMTRRESAGITSGRHGVANFERFMRTLIALILVLVALCYAFPANAAETTPIKCGVNEDRVWVYDSLNSFDVALKLKCGEPVEIIGREKGYVKIRTSSGKEGYVPEKALPKPPEAEGNNQSSSAAQASSQDGPQSVAAAARARTAAISASRATAKPAEHVSINVEPTTSVAEQPASTPDSTNASNSTARTSNNPAETNRSAPSATGTNSAGNAKPQPAPTHSQAKPVTYAPAHSTAKPTDSASANSKTASVSGSKTKPPSSNAAAVSTKVVAPKTSPAKAVPVSNASAETAAPASAPAAPSKIELSDNVPSEPSASRGSSSAAPSPRDPDDEEDLIVKPVENREACRIYFSAYGLSPNQYKWMTRNRGKSFPGICPAPAPAMVDFVVIFTHDADFYNGTMPTLVHTDKNGFSDFTPLTTVDTAVVSPSEANKNRREYVWVFHTKRGTFEPAKFSPKRRPLFSTTESNMVGTAAGGRSAEDALRFIEQHGVDH